MDQPPQSEKNRHRKTTHIHDARGRKVVQLDPYEMWLLHQHDAIDAETLKQLADEIGSGVDAKRRRGVRVFMIVGSILAIVFAIQVVDLALHGRLLEVLRPQNFGTFSMCFVAWALWVKARNARFRKVREIMLAHHRCPHCGYDLAGLREDASDGAIVCPECGCAWKRSEADTQAS